MYSPKERIYNTPEMGGSVGNSVLMQLRLESILRKYGRLPCCEPYVYNSRPVAIPELQRPTYIPRPLNDVKLYERYRRIYDLSHPAPSTVPRETQDKCKCQHEQVDPAGVEKKKRSGIPGAPPDDPYLQRQRDTVSGCKYGGVNLSVLRTKKPKPELFQPFYPQKSPLRLPSIQREKSTIKETTDAAPTLLTDRDLAKHVRILEKQRTREITKHKLNAKKRINKKVHREQEFHRWEQSQDKYLQQVQSLDSDHQILKNLEKFHEAERPVEEQTQRMRISEEIRQGVQRKLKLFHKDDAKVKENPIPVRNVQFWTDFETYEQDKTTASTEQKTKPSCKQSKKSKI